MVLGSALWIWSAGNSKSSSNLIADIYQDGTLIKSIPLDEVKEDYTFAVTGDTGCENIIAVQPGSIGIQSASCPDKLCVKQGFISNTRLPITCLPNHLVIQLREEIDASEKNDNEVTVDIVTY